MSKKNQPTTEHTFITQVTLPHLKAQKTDDDLAPVFKEAHQMHHHIPCLIAVATGENQSSYHRGFTHGIVLHFVDEQHLRDAMMHEKYRKLQQKVNHLVAEVVTFELPETFHLPTPPQETPSEQAPVPKQQRKQRRSPSTPPVLTPEEREQDQQRARLFARMRHYETHVTEIDSRLKCIVLDQLGVDENEVVPHASLVEDLGADSLDLVEYIMGVEEAFHIQIPDEDADKLTTIAETQAYLKAKDSL